MAIYHVRISSGSRADGQSAAVKIAYILREGAYGGRDDLVCWGSGNMPPWAAADPRQLFEAADLYERSNGRLFLHVWVALPNELTDAERHELALAIAAALTAAGLPFVYAVHAGDPKSPGEPANPHVHIVISERITDGIPRDARQWFRRANPREPARGGAAKDRRLKEVSWVDDARRVVARLTNEHLALAGCKARVTADSNEIRIVEAEAWGDTETADVLRRHPPGVHLGPAAAAIERDRIGGKRDEAPKVLRQGEPTDRGDLARAKAAEEERGRGELERVSAKLRRARGEEVRATESVAAARSAGVSDDRILAVYEESESTAEGSGWAAVEEAASSQSGRKKEAEAAAALLGIDVESVVRVALEQDGDPVAALAAAVASFEAARSALLSDEAIEGIRCDAESGELGSGWAAVAEAARRRLAWKARAEPAAREAGIADVEVVYAAALSRGEDPLAALESVTAVRLERKKQAENAAGETGIIDIETEYGRARDVGEDPLSMLERATNMVVAARAALVTDETIQAQHAAAELRERGSGWRAVEKASQTRSAWKGRAEAAAREAGIADVEVVYAAALSRGEDPLAALESVTAVRLERKKQAENAAGETGIIDIETEYGRARDVGEDPLSMLERATNMVVAARAALVTDETIQAQHAAAESRERGSGWRAVEKASQTRSAWKGRAEPAAREAGIADVEVVYAAALSRGEDPLAALESVTAVRLERKKQAENAAGETGIIDIETEYGRARDVGEDPLSMLERATNMVVAARAALVTDETIQAQHAAAESRERGSGWRAVEKASQTRSAWKGRAEPAAREAGIADVEVVYAAALSRGEDPLAALESVTAVRLERKKQAENAAGETGIIDIETEYGRARDVGEDPLSMLERATNMVVAARAALVTDETIQAQHAAAESRERGSGWRAVEKASQTRSAWKGRAEVAAREAGIADVEVVYAASLSRGEDPLAALESVTAARLERKKQAENAAGETGIIDIETEYGRARDVGEDPLSMLERATNMVVAARAALVTDETIQAQHAAAELRERGSGWRAVEKASQTRSAWKGRAEAAARAAGIADVEVVYAAALSRGEDPLAALEAATAARQAAARRRAAVEGREAAIRATRVGADWLLEAEQRVLRAADRRLTLEEREGIAETVERRIREHLDSCLEALAATVGGAELLEEMQADASAATLAAQERVIELAEQRFEEHLAEQQRLFAQPVGEDLFTAHLAARDPAWRPGGRTTAENRTAALRAAEAEGARLARARDVFDGRWSRRHYRLAAGALGGRFTLADVDAALTAAEGFAGRVAGLSGGTGLAVLTEAVAAGGELTVADLEAAVEGAEQAERQAARREALSAGGRELYAVRLAALAAADRRAGETPSGAVVDQALDETESDAVRLPCLDALFGDAELRSYYRGTLGSAGDQHQVPLAQLDAVLRATEAFRDRRNTVLQYPSGDQHPGGAALWAAEQRSLSPAVVAVAFDTALARVESRLENRVQQAADEVERLLPTTQPYSLVRPDFRVPALGDERLEDLGQLRLEPADAFVEATVAELRERYDTRDKLRYSPQDRLKSEREHLGRVVEMTWDRELRLWSPSSTSPQPTRSSALARVVKKYVLKIWEIVLVACDKILGGDLGERLRRRREQIEKAADVAERLLPTISLISCASPVPVAGDAGLAGVVTDTTAPVVGDAVEVVWARYSERRYSAVDRDLAAKAYLAFPLEVAEARQQREGLRSDSSVLPTLDDARAIVLEEHQSSLRQIFAVACDEVFAPGELATQWRRRRDQVQLAVNVVEACQQTTRLLLPDRDVPVLSHETLIALAAAEADPRRRAMWRELGERYHHHASLGTPYEHRYSADDRTEAEGAYLAGALKMAQGRYSRGWVRSLSSAAHPPPLPTPASVLEEHRSNLRNIFKLALDEVSGGGELGKRRCLRRDQVRRAVDAVEAALSTTRPDPVVRPDHHVPALSDNRWDAFFDVETDPFLQAMWRELGERYHRRDSDDTRIEQRYSADDRHASESAHLNEVSTKKYERQLQTWRSSTRESARPTLADAEASALKEHQAEIRGIFTTARDEVLRGDAVRARRQEEPDRPVGISKAARGDAVPVSEGSSAGSLQPKAEIAGARQAQASSREEKPAPAAAEPPTPDVVELVAKDSEQKVLPIFNGTLAVSNGQLDDIEYCIGNNRDVGYEVALEAVERIRQVHQHDAAARAAAETAYYAPAARKRLWQKLLSSATEELMWEMAIEHAGKITDVCRERLGLRDDGDTGGGAPPSPKRLEPPDPGAAGSGGGPSVKTPAPLPPADGDRGPRR